MEIIHASKFVAMIEVRKDGTASKFHIRLDDECSMVFGGLLQLSSHINNLCITTIGQ